MAKLPTKKSIIENLQQNNIFAAHQALMKLTYAYEHFLKDAMFLDGYDSVRRVGEFLESGGDLNYKFGIRKETALHLACERDKKMVVKFLLDNGADPTVKDWVDRQPKDYTKDPEIQEMLAKASQVKIALKPAGLDLKL